MSVAGQIQDILNQSKLIVGYNVQFDIDFLNEAGFTVPLNRFDVMTEFKSSHGQLVSHKLIDCANFYGISFQAHNAAEDTYATWQCFEHLLDEFSSDEISIGRSNRETRKKPKFSLRWERKRRRKHFLLCGLGLVCIAGLAEHYLIIQGYYGKISILQTDTFAFLNRNRLEMIVGIIALIGVLSIIIGIIHGIKIMVKRFIRVIKSKR